MSLEQNVGQKEDEKHLDEYPPHVLTEAVEGVRGKAGLAAVEQIRVIPIAGERKVTSNLEWWLYTLFYFSGQGVGIGSYGGSLQQALLTAANPSGFVFWGGQTQAVTSVVLDLNGILFAAQLACLLILGPYADYGTWRAWLTIVFQTVLNICTIAMAGLNKPSQWQAACALYVIGNLGLNVANVFYLAATPGLARDLPHMIELEKEVAEGNCEPAELAEADMLERSKLYNWLNIVGSFTNLALLGVATGVAYAIGSATIQDTLKSYQVLLGMFGAMTVLCTTPWFIVGKHRPGQKLPDGTKWWQAGPRQVYQAARYLKDLKQPLLYLIAYFLLQESFGTSFNVVGVLQNKMINFNTFDLSGLNLVSYLGGGGGTVLCQIVQRRFRIPVKKMLVYGAIMTLGPNLWGVIGAYTQTIGFHHEWEFWLASAYNFQTAAFGSYAVTMISEVVPAPKIYLFLALFNTVGKTSGFVGPFITSAIINKTGNPNIAFWFLLGMGMLGCVVLYFVDTDKAKIDSARFLEQEARDLYGISIQTEEERRATLKAE